MVPVAGRPDRKLLPPLHEQHARVADLPRPTLVYPEALGEVTLIALTVREARGRRLGPAYTAPFKAAVDLGFMEAEHGGDRSLAQACNAICNDTRQKAVSSGNFNKNSSLDVRFDLILPETGHHDELTFKLVELNAVIQIIRIHTFFI